MATEESGAIDLQEILQVAKEAAKLAGAEINRVWWHDVPSASQDDDHGNHGNNGNGEDAATQPKIETKSNSVDLVTETDQKCEELVLELLRSKYPAHAIIGEESCGTHGTYELTDAPTWTVDPIDGTTNFVHRLGLSCVLIAFLRNKEVQVGVIYNPTSEELFWAVRGSGAFLQTRDATVRKLRVSATTDITQAVVAMDPGYGRDALSVHRYQSVQRQILERGVRHVRVLGCCGVCLAYVACGRFDACFEEGSWEDGTGPKIWDLCAGKLIIEEAGGVTRDITGRSSKDRPMDVLQRSVFAAATPQLADQLLDIMYNTK